jgi:hypothetical protein
MGCVYSNNETPKSEVVNDVEKIRESEKCNEYHMSDSLNKQTSFNVLTGRIVLDSSKSNLGLKNYENNLESNVKIFKTKL